MVAYAHAMLARERPLNYCSFRMDAAAIAVMSWSSVTFRAAKDHAVVARCYDSKTCMVVRADAEIAERRG